MHWTYELANKNLIDGFKFTLIRRGGNGEHRRFNNIWEYFNATESLFNKKIEKSRLSLLPQKDGRYFVMEYPNDGTFWVKGIIIEGKYE